MILANVFSLLTSKLSDREPSWPGGDAWPRKTSEKGQQDGGAAVRSGFYCPAALIGRAAAASDRDLFPPLAKREPYLSSTMCQAVFNTLIVRRGVAA